MLRPNALVIGNVEGYLDLEWKADQHARSIEEALSDDDTSREYLERLRPRLQEQTRLFESHLAPARAETCKDLVPVTVGVAAHLGAVLLAPNVEYIPSIDFGQQDQARYGLSDYMEQTAEEYMRGKPALTTFVNQSIRGGDILDSYVRRTVRTVAGLILWQAENQYYQSFIDERAKEFTRNLEAFDGEFPGYPPSIENL